MADLPDAVAQRIVILKRDRWLAHQLFFPHRHLIRSAPAHKALVSAIYGYNNRQVIEGFRGFAKTTYLEEAAIIRALFREFHNMVILSVTYTLACERIASIKREMTQNEEIAMLFGPMQGPTWREDKIELSNGIAIQAIGRDQSMTGTKHIDWRPDAALIDDVEDPEERRSETERDHTWTWFLQTFMPALDSPNDSWVRVLGTRRGRGSLPERLENAGWPTVKFPIEYVEEGNFRAATWPGKFPIEEVDKLKRLYRGDMETYHQEYMCEAHADQSKVFRDEYFRVVPRVRSWENAMTMYDPARSVNRRSATTGKARWSWIGNRLVVWEAQAEMWLPDRIIDDIVDEAVEEAPTWIGVEEDGLNEFIMQPLRHAQTRYRLTVPIRGIRAPKGKTGFIAGLQAFFKTGEVEFAKPLPQLVEQLLSFPYGRIDAPNALAYCLLLRPGAPMYDNFTETNIEEDAYVIPGRPIYLAANSDGRVTTAALVQLVDGQLRIVADFIREGLPAEVVADIHMEAAIFGDTTREVVERIKPETINDLLKVPEHRAVLRRMPLSWVVPPAHGERYGNVGLAQAIRAIPANCALGADPVLGRDHIRDRLDSLVRGNPAVVVSSSARWALNGFTGGYARHIDRQAVTADTAEANTYRILLEGIEAFAGMAERAAAAQAEDDGERNYSYNAAGERYQSALPARR